MILMTTNAGGNGFVNPDTEAANGDYKLELTNWQISFCCNDNLPITGKFTYIPSSLKYKSYFRGLTQQSLSIG
jgi:hypothetical protein